MSETVIFAIGAVIFAITVYGSVMAGGLALSRLDAKENDPIVGQVDRPSESSVPPPDSEQ